MLSQYINNSFQFFKNGLKYININFQYFNSRFLNIYSTAQMSLVAKTKNVLSRVQVGANISSQTNFIVRNQVSGKTVSFFLTFKSFKNWFVNLVHKNLVEFWTETPCGETFLDNLIWAIWNVRSDCQVQVEHEEIERSNIVGSIPCWMRGDINRQLH